MTSPQTDSLEQTARPRGPSPDKTARTRRAIAVAALDTFLERGFSATRMIDVSQRAGVAKGTLYLYFTDKEALFEGVLTEVIAAPIASVRETEPAPGESVHSFLRRVVVPLMRDFENSRRADVARLVIAEGAHFPALAATYRRLALDPVHLMIRRLGQIAVERGEISSDALVRFPLLMLAPGLAATAWNGLFGIREPVDTGAVFAAWVDLVFRG
jgi:AcrR family transcriptional regulator